MKLSSALDLKSELVSEARSAFVASREAVGLPGRELLEMRVALTHHAPRSTPAAVRVAHATPRPVAAFGVAPTSRRDDYALAVRVFHGEGRAAGSLLKSLDLPESEIDLATGLRYRPRLVVRAGGSCGHYRITAGTLGGFVEDDDEYYILSNNHVLANSDDASVGDPILQPGPADAGRSKPAIIGHLKSWVPLGRGKGKVDAAIATFTDRVKHFYPWEYRGIGSAVATPVSGRHSVRRVAKLGRTTGATFGTVSAFDLDGVAIDYSHKEDGSKVVVFDNQLEFVHEDKSLPFSQGGDSGSFILDRETLRPYALLYGGGPDDQKIDRTLGHFLPEVLDELGVRLVQ